MVEIYIMENISRYDSEGWFKDLPIFIQDRINKYSNKDVVRQKVCAYKFLLKILKDRYGVLNYELQYHKGGKPYLKNYPDLYFNISHDTNSVAIAIGNSEVGVDIMDQSNKYIDDVAKKAFHPNENKEIEKSKDKDLKFIEIWTRKESYLKYHGQRIDEQMHNLNKIDTLSLRIFTDIKENFVVSCTTKDKEISEMVLIEDNLNF